MLLFFCVFCPVFFKIGACGNRIITWQVFIGIFAELFHDFIWCKMPRHILFIFVFHQLYLNSCSKCFMRPCFIFTRFNTNVWRNSFIWLICIFYSCQINIVIKLGFLQCLRFSDASHFLTFWTLLYNYVLCWIINLRVHTHKIWLFSIEEVLEGNYFVSGRVQSRLEV